MILTSNSNAFDKGHEGDQPTILFRELAREDGTVPGRTIAFTDAKIQPLNYADLAHAKLHKKLTIPFNWDSSRIIETNVADLDKSKSYSVKTTLESAFTSRAIGLVKGGWLPSALAATSHNTTVLVDRNVVSDIIGRFDGGKKVSTELDFLDLFADRPVRINPMLFANGRQYQEYPDAGPCA